MPQIHLETIVAAPIERVFDLARSLDLHQRSMMHTRERAVGGVTHGLLGLHEVVTWEAHHFGVRQRLTVELTRLERPSYFQDVMLDGAFAHMVHDHRFETLRGATRMLDLFDFRAPGGPIGRVAERAFLTRYMTRLLHRRNQVLKEVAESDQWPQFLRDVTQGDRGSSVTERR